MFLISQIVVFLFLAFMLGVGVGYMIWQSWGQREYIARYNAAELKLARYLSEWEARMAPSPLRSDGLGKDASGGSAASKRSA